MAQEIAFENGQISNFEGLMTLTLTLDRVILHTVVHHSSTSTYMLNLIEIEKKIMDGRTYACTCTYRRTDGRRFETGFIRSTLLKSQLKNDTTEHDKILPGLADQQLHASEFLNADKVGR